MPAVSVVIPTYNSAPYIAETLLSVQQQTLQDRELLVVDDGSSDDTVREVERFSGSMDLKIIRQANAGPAAARNAGIRAARGRYCAFLDADDLMLPGRLAEQAALLDGHPQMALAHTDLMTFDERGLIHQTRRAFSDPCGGMILDRLLLDNSITTSTVMARTDKLIEAGLFGERRRISEDFELWLRMAERWEVGFIERPLVRYRRRPGSLSDDKLTTGLAALEVIEAFWRSHPEYGAEHPRLQRRSMAKHLAAAGAAALHQGKSSSAARLMLRSLRYNAADLHVWKQLAKIALRAGRGTPHQPSRKVA